MIGGKNLRNLLNQPKTKPNCHVVTRVFPPFRQFPWSHSDWPLSPVLVSFPSLKKRSLNKHFDMWSFVFSDPYSTWRFRWAKNVEKVQSKAGTVRAPGFLLPSSLAAMFSSLLSTLETQTQTECTASLCFLYSIHFFWFQLSVSDRCSYPWSAFFFEQKLSRWV